MVLLRLVPQFPFVPGEVSVVEGAWRGAECAEPKAQVRPDGLLIDRVHDHGRAWRGP
jgi:hypothetical protein